MRLGHPEQTPAARWLPAACAATAWPGSQPAGLHGLPECPTEIQTQQQASTTTTADGYTSRRQPAAPAGSP